MGTLNRQTSLEPVKSVHSVAGTTVQFEFSLPADALREELRQGRLWPLCLRVPTAYFVLVIRTCDGALGPNTRRSEPFCGGLRLPAQHPLVG